MENDMKILHTQNKYHNGVPVLILNTQFRTPPDSLLPETLKFESNTHFEGLAETTFT